jgi:DNA-binding transcriptional MerR regulator
MTRGEVAEAADVTAETVRYYEERGLIPAPRRSAAGYRLYGSAFVERIRFIKRAQELGFTLSETEGLLAVGLDAPDGECGDVRAQALAKLADVEARLHDLEAIRDALRALA